MKTAKAKQKNYGPIKQAFAEFLANPARGFQREFSDQYEVDQATLSQWKAEPKFQELVDKLTENWQAPALRSVKTDVIPAMIRAASAGDVQAARLIGDWLGLNAPKKFEGKMGLIEWFGTASAES